MILMLTLFTNFAKSQVAMFTHVGGRVEIRLEGESDWKSARLLQKLYRGSDVRCNDSGEATLVILKSGERFLLDAGGRGKVGSDSISGGKSLGGLRGASALAAKTLGGSRVGGALSRAPIADSALEPSFKGWLSSTSPKFHWKSVPGAIRYTFTLFDREENVVWSASSKTENAEYPDDLPEILTARPYVWRLTPFGKSGRQLGTGTRWGVVTFLTQEQEKSLLDEVEPLLAQAMAEPKNSEPLLMLAEKYRKSGVYQRTLECIGALGLLMKEPQESIEAAREDAYREIGRLAVLFGVKEESKKRE